MESHQHSSEEANNSLVTASHKETKDSVAKPQKYVYSFMEVKEKLITYYQHNTDEKDRWLMACHAHCFIVLS